MLLTLLLTYPQSLASRLTINANQRSSEKRKSLTGFTCALKPLKPVATSVKSLFGHKNSCVCEHIHAFLKWMWYSRMIIYAVSSTDGYQHAWLWVTSWRRGERRPCLKAATYPITKFWVLSSFQATKQDFTSYWSQSENKQTKINSLWWLKGLLVTRHISHVLFYFKFCFLWNWKKNSILFQLWDVKDVRIGSGWRVNLNIRLDMIIS